MNYKLKERQIVINRLASSNRELKLKANLYKWIGLPLLFLIGLFIGVSI